MPSVADTIRSDETHSLQREQLESLYRRITDEPNSEFELDRLPPNALLFAAVWSLHLKWTNPRSVVRESDNATGSQVCREGGKDDARTDERHGPDLQAYSDALLLTALWSATT